MQLMTAEIEKALKKNPLYSQDGKGRDSKIVVKYFGGSAATWLITEGEPEPGGDWLLYGFVTLGLPDEFAPGKLLWEWGLRETQRTPVPLVPALRSGCGEGHPRGAREVQGQGRGVHVPPVREGLNGLQDLGVLPYLWDKRVLRSS